jgi:transcriptional regulator with XRE-family HTH domain
MLNLRQLRIDSGLSVNQMADRLSVKPDTYRKWESETNAIPLEKAWACADVFHCTLDELAGRKAVMLSEDEIALLGLYRSTDDRGRAAIMAIAESQRGDEGEAASGMSESA